MGRPAARRPRAAPRGRGARLEPVGQSSLYALLIDGRPHELFALERAEGYDIVIGWDRYSVGVNARDRRGPPPPAGEQTLEEHPAGGWAVLSPMAGGVVEVYAKAGDAVAEGDVLMLIEAMKMNNELRAQREGTVREVHVQVGQRVGKEIKGRA